MKHTASLLAAGLLLVAGAASADAAKGQSDVTSIKITAQEPPPARSGLDMSTMVDPTKIQSRSPATFSLDVRLPAQTPKISTSAPLGQTEQAQQSTPPATSGSAFPGVPSIPAAQPLTSVAPSSVGGATAPGLAEKAGQPVIGGAAAAIALVADEETAAMLERARTPVKTFSTLQAAGDAGVDPLNERVSAAPRPAPVAQAKPAFDWRDASQYLAWAEANLDQLLIYLAVAIGGAVAAKLLAKRRK
jgi:hypothetical protein